MVPLKVQDTISLVIIQGLAQRASAAITIPAVVQVANLVPKFAKRSGARSVERNSVRRAAHLLPAQNALLNAAIITVQSALIKAAQSALWVAAAIIAHARNLSGRNVRVAVPTPSKSSGRDVTAEDLILDPRNGARSATRRVLALAAPKSGVKRAERDPTLILALILIKDHAGVADLAQRAPIDALTALVVVDLDLQRDFATKGSLPRSLGVH